MILLIVASYSASSQINSEKIFERYSPSIVYILDNSTQDGQSYGTGFFINESGNIITNFHVIKGSTQMIVVTKSGDSYPVKDILAYNISSDLACLSVDIPSQYVVPLRISSTLPKIGEKIFVIGYPEGPSFELYPSMTDGMVSSIQYRSEYGEIIRIHGAGLLEGNSGSPCVNKDGDVIGVTTFGYIEGLHELDFAISCRELLNLIRNTSDGIDGIPLSKFNLTSNEYEYITYSTFQLLVLSL